MRSFILLLTAISLSITQLSAQIIVSESMNSTVLNTSTDADNSTAGAFSTDIEDLAMNNPSRGAEINSDFDGDPSLAIQDNAEGNLTYAFDSTGLTGMFEVSFKLAVIDDGVQGVGDAEASPTLRSTLWGEVHPWNSVGTFDSNTTGDNGGFFADSNQ